MNTFNEYLLLFFFFFFSLVGTYITEIIYKGIRDYSILPNGRTHEESIFPFVIRLAIYSGMTTFMFYIVNTYVIH